ncbi:OmpA family protein [Vibrio sp. T187]|uniref:OmpA family protein n=1 Tax=Vibrio TaxID=662 RepID=UPI0010CA0F2A|nr:MULTISPECIES: OmpA family protein [Vibrio]MBW3696977.1 OmpA family protein [Vibrio sp. T187]
MLKQLLPLLLLPISVNALASQDDEFEYRATPIANQASDLLDDDNDGVINARDLCPDTPSRAELDNDGCGTFVKTSQKMQLHVLFANNSTEVNPVFLTQIREMAGFLKQYSSTSIELQGYASKTGKASHNLMLSKERANNVKQALIGNGISHTRIKIVGYGDENLSEKGTDELSHAKNRKVVASVVGFKGNVKEEWHIFTTIDK